jgi:hypothetical protein
VATIPLVRESRALRQALAALRAKHRRAVALATETCGISERIIDASQALLIRLDKQRRSG